MGRAQGTEYVGESVDKGLVPEALPVGQLDKPEAAIIDQPARPQRLDSGVLQNHLRDLGFPPPSAVCGADRQQQRNPSAGRQLARAVEGLLHVMGVLRERDEVRTGFERSARRLQHSLHPNGLESAPFGTWWAAARTSPRFASTEGRGLKSTEDRGGPIGSNSRIGQCVMRGSHGWVGARLQDRKRVVIRWQ